MKKILATMLASAMVLGTVSVSAFAQVKLQLPEDAAELQIVVDEEAMLQEANGNNEDSSVTDENDVTECEHDFGAWTYESGNHDVCIHTCKKCGKKVSHEAELTNWQAPVNGNRNYCESACDICGRIERHVTQGEWTEKEDGSYSRICTTCGAEQTCDHSRGYGVWRCEGDECVRKCLGCESKERHETQWSDYLPVNEKEKHYCTARYCLADTGNGKICNNANRIDTVEELLAAIEAGFTEIQPDAWEPYFDPTISGRTIVNSPITVTEDVTIDGGETGVTIKRLGFGYGDSKKPTFIVENGATLTLKNLTIEGGGGDMSGSPMILVKDGGTVILDDGAVLTKGGSYGPCSGVYLENGDLVMNEGSKITDIVSDSSVNIVKGVFTMNGGELSGNRAAGVGSSGVVMLNGSEPESAKFIMNEGVISGSFDSRNFGMGTVSVACGTMEMNGGQIINNPSGGIIVSQGSLAVTGGEISGNGSSESYVGGGILSEAALGFLGNVSNMPSITISGGTIQNNSSLMLGNADVILGFTDADITDGYIGNFLGNYETLKAVIVLEGGNPEELTEEELLQYAMENLGYTEEQIAIKPEITGGIFETDVQKYIAETEAEISYSTGEKNLYAVGKVSTAELLKDAGEGAEITVIAGTDVKGVPEGVLVINGTDNPVSVNGGPAIEAGGTTTAHDYKVISVEFEDVTAADAEGEKLYNINLVAADDEMINRLNAADLTFAFEQLEGSVGYEIIASNNEISVNAVDGSAARYEFHYKGKDDVLTDSASTITIGQIKFTGYGSFNFAVDTSAVTNCVHATTTADNLVDSYTPDGEKTVLILDSKLENVEIAVPTRVLTINLTFPNAIEYNDAVYQDMTVTIVGGTVNETIKLGLEETYSIIEELPYNTAYTVTVSGAGYRTARYTVTMTEDKVLNFWNNVMDAPQVVETGKESSAVTKNFLAGDIVKDNNINIYDLSAVVSYFGTDNLISDHPEYAKYDLNRDGKIDSKDVAMVLVSWGE